MERPTKKVQRRLVVPPPVSDHELAAVLRSFEGKKSLTLRLAVALRDARLDLSRYRELSEEQQRAWQSRERVLVVSETDGVVEVFTAPWVSVKHVEVRPWEDRDELVQALSAEWRALDTAPQSRLLVVPQIRPKLDDAALVDLARWHGRVTVIEKLLELRKP